MSDDPPADGRPHEIIIVRRKRGGGHAEHHGGVWKIAFADFMTAMMAFFLVLWIVNSTSKETRTSIARYFNPIKLAETSPARKGLQDLDSNSPEDTARESQAPPEKESKGKDTKASPAEPGADKQTNGKPPPAGNDGRNSGRADDGDKALGASDIALQPGQKEPTFSEAALLADPMAALAKIAERGINPAGPEGLARRDSFSDPFEPIAPPSSPSLLVRPPAKAEAQSGLASRSAVGEPVEIKKIDPALNQQNDGGLKPVATERTRETDVESSQAKIAETAKNIDVDLNRQNSDGATAAATRGATQPGVEGSQAKIAETAKNIDTDLNRQNSDGATAAATRGATQPGVEGSQAKIDETVKNTDPDMNRQIGGGPRAVATAGARDLEAEGLQVKINEALRGVAEARGSPHVEMRNTNEGLLISLTDGLDFSMFALGSAEPQARTIQAIERIGQVLKSNNDMIVVRGHTDAKPYRTGASDNWRLSALRAQMAFYMLMRGGVSDKRLERIEAHADRLPRNRSKPDAAENRRVEILIRKRQDVP